MSRIINYITLLILVLLFPSPTYSFMSGTEMASLQEQAQSLPVGERVALWAEKFVGTPYDPDPLGQYVTRAVIVADERVDCMYLAFRAVELALSRSPGEAVRVALDKRFITQGLLKDGHVLNYEDRFRYAADMLDSGKWGTEITLALAETIEIEGSRGRDTVSIIPKADIPDMVGSLTPGDIVFFIKAPEKRVVGEIVGHIGILKREGNTIFLIHASGSKNTGGEVKGEVKKLPFTEYAVSMPFAGIRVSRFQ